MSNEGNRLKNFLIYGPQTPSREGEPKPAEAGEEEIEQPETVTETEQAPATPDVDDPSLKAIESELIRIRYMLEDLSSRPVQGVDTEKYLTTREQSKAINATVARLETTTGNKTLLHAMEQICTMREDFLRLCRGMRPRIHEMDPETVLSSFEAYCVDMENILTDGGVYVGSFDYDRLNTLHQRIVGIVPTGERERDGTIAERQSDGYKLGDKVLLKERVTVYKYNPSTGTPEEAPEEETASQTDSETDYEGRPADGGTGITEEKE